MILYLFSVAVMLVVIVVVTRHSGKLTVGGLVMLLPMAFLPAINTFFAAAALFLGGMWVVDWFFTTVGKKVLWTRK
jgi:hypothetical protein